MRQDVALRCQLLAVGAWCATLVWFGIATVASWGFTPVSLLLWTLPAWPLLRLTQRWWDRSGRPLASSTDAWLRRLWRNLAIACAAYYALIIVTSTVFGDHHWFQVGFGWSLVVFGAVCGVFPSVLGGWAIWRSARLRSAQSHPSRCGRSNVSLQLTSARSAEVVAVYAYRDAITSTQVSRILSRPLAAELG